MTMTCDFGNLPVSEIKYQGVARFYVTDGDKRMVFTKDGVYMYSYNYVNPIWE